MVLYPSFLLTHIIPGSISRFYYSFLLVFANISWFFQFLLQHLPFVQLLIFGYGQFYWHIPALQHKACPTQLTRITHRPWGVSDVKFFTDDDCTQRIEGGAFMVAGH